MPRIIVMTDPSPLSADASIWLDEHVQSVHLSTNHAAAQFVERLAWAISDAEDADAKPASHRVRPARQPHTHSSATRSRTQRRVRA
jgi:hypothetical protein